MVEPSLALHAGDLGLGYEGTVGQVGLDYPLCDHRRRVFESAVRKGAVLRCWPG